MRNLKKILSLVLCMAMMLSVMVVGAGAAFKDQNKIVNTEAVDMCEALNIINGYTDGSFKPEGTITRAEACKMICVALNGGKEPVLGTSATATFTDIKGHWAEGYIEYCVSEGIVAGIGGGKFAPNATVTGSQFAKMLLIALGYRADHENFLGNAWEVNVNVKASAKGLYEDLESMDPTVALTRDNAAQMVWNALQANEVAYNYTLATENGQLVSKVTVEDKQVNGATITMLKDKYNALIKYAYMDGISYNDDKDEYTYSFRTEAAFGGAAISSDALVLPSVKTSDDYSDLFGQRVAVVYKNNNDKTVYGMYASESSIVATGIVDDISDIDGKDLKIDGTKYTLTNNVNATKVWAYNVNTNCGMLSAYATDANAHYAFALIDNTDDGKADGAIVYPYTVGQITYLNSGKFTVKAGGTSATYKIDDVNMYDGVAEDDYVVITAAVNTVDNTVTYEKLNTVIKGDITATKDAGKTFTVDGTAYKVAVKAATINNTDYTAEAGDTVKEAAVYNGFVFYLDKSDSALVEDYALITGYKPADGINNAQVKLLFTDGTEKVVDLDDDAENYNSWTEDNVGDLVTYDVDDNEYTLTAALTTQTADKESGFDAIVSGSYAYKKDGKSTIGGNYIADDAVVFVKDGNDYKVITGAKLAKITGSVTVNNAYADKNDSTGYTTVALASVVANVTSDDLMYGYVVSDVETVKNADGDKVLSFTIFDGEKDIPVLTVKEDANKSIEKGNVVQYTEDDGAIDIDKVYVIENNAGAIAKYNGSDEITFVAELINETIAGTSKQVVKHDSAADKTFTNYEIDENTVIICVDNEDNTGIPGGTLSLASETPAGNYYANVFATFSGTDHVDLIVFSNDLLNVM